MTRDEYIRNCGSDAFLDAIQQSISDWHFFDGSMQQRIEFDRKSSSLRSDRPT